MATINSKKHFFISTVPNSSQDSVEVISDNILRVKVKAKPVDGEANRRLIQVLSDHFQVEKSKIKIKSGATSRQKIVIIS